MWSTSQISLAGKGFYSEFPRFDSRFLMRSGDVPQKLDLSTFDLDKLINILMRCAFPSHYANLIVLIKYSITSS